MEKKDYYTSGELANLFQIPRQTMFHYAKMGLLTPEFHSSWISPVCLIPIFGS